MNYYETVGCQGRQNSSLAQVMCNSPVDRSKQFINDGKKYLFGVTGKLSTSFTACPLAPLRDSATKFSSCNAFFRSCRAKQNETSSYNSKEGGLQKKYKQCLKCKQATASRRNRIVVVLADIGVVIDEEMAR